MTDEASPARSESSGEEGLNISEFEASDGDDEEWRLSPKPRSQPTSTVKLKIKSPSSNGAASKVVVVPGPGPREADPRLFCGVSDCLFSCRDEGRLGVHRRSQHQHLTHPKPFKCDQCDFRFERASRLARHQKRHSKKHTVFCQVCNKGKQA